MSSGEDQRDPEAEAERLEHEIDGMRAALEQKITELSARRRWIDELRGHARRHPWASAAFALVLASALGFAIGRRSVTGRRGDRE
jgi:hypothetical protein